MFVFSEFLIMRFYWDALYDMIRSYNLEFDVHENYYTNWINKIIWKYHIYWEIYKTKYIVDFHLKIIYIIYLILLVFKQHFNRFIFLQRDWACKYFNYIAETYLTSNFVGIGWWWWWCGGAYKWVFESYLLFKELLYIVPAM